MKRKPTRAALHRLIGVDTDIMLAASHLRMAVRQDPRALGDLGIDLAPMAAELERHLETIRERARAMFAETYPQQPESGR